MNSVERVKKICKSRHIPIYKLERDLGYANGYIGQLKKGVFPMNRHLEIARYLGVSPEYLATGVERIPMSETDASEPIPVLDHVADPQNAEATGDMVTTTAIPMSIDDVNEYFGLLVHDASMSPRIMEGDIIIAHNQDTAQSGDTVVASINGNDAIVRRMQVYRDGIALLPANPTYEPMYFSQKDMAAQVRILGKVVEIRGKI